MVLAKQKFGLRERDLKSLGAQFVPFSAHTRMSGVDLDGPAASARAPPDAMRAWVESQGGALSRRRSPSWWTRVSRRGSTPLVVADGARVLGVIVLGAGLVGGALALNVGWVIVSWRQAGLLLLGVLVFPLIITGVVLNTIFLVREIRRNEQHEAFINAVTHELKTPVASLKLYLQTLQNRQVDEAKRQEFYRTMLEDSDRLLVTIEQVLRAGQIGARVRHGHRLPVNFSALVQECLALARTRYRLPPDALTYRESDRCPAARRGACSATRTS